MSLIVVSNRVALPSDENQSSAGGLSVGLHDALNEEGGIWFGWSGKICPPNTVAEIQNNQKGKIKYKTIDLLEEDYNLFYRQFSNATLWPLFHFRLDLAVFSKESYLGYLRVNKNFASVLSSMLQKDDIVWVHDYHFIPLAADLRKERCTQKLGYFQHVPWPPKELLQALPNHRELIKKLLEYDVIGFQTRDDVRRFMDYIVNEFGGSLDPSGFVYADRKRAMVRHFPISIDFAKFKEVAKGSEKSLPTQRLAKTTGASKLILGVDRLDYSKGIINRLKAYERLLYKHPEHKRSSTFLQISPPTREGVQHYRDLRNEIERKAGHINGLNSDFDWTAVRYLNKGYPRETLAGFYRSSAVAFVTPLRDGMNLVAKEFVAAQSADNPGVLILSRFAGAAAELQGALQVNPYDPDEMCDALHIALTMPLEDRVRRWALMYQQIEISNLEVWWRRFIDALNRVQVQ